MTERIKRYCIYKYILKLWKLQPVVQTCFVKATPNANTSRPMTTITPVTVNAIVVAFDTVGLSEKKGTRNNGFPSLQVITNAKTI